MDDDGNPKYMTLGEKEAKFLEAMAVSFLDDSISQGVEACNFVSLVIVVHIR